jgi:hypothetical protein
MSRELNQTVLENLLIHCQVTYLIIQHTILIFLRVKQDMRIKQFSNQRLFFFMLNFIKLFKGQFIQPFNLMHSLKKLIIGHLKVILILGITLR